MSDEPHPELVLSRDTSLSEAALWEVQRSYYEDLGHVAWEGRGGVPFLITTTAYIAWHHASWITAMLLDGLRSQTLDPQRPIYVVELAAGTGIFAHRLLVALERQLAAHEVRLDLRYVLTDLASANLDLWGRLPAWRERFTRGDTQRAFFDLERPGPLRLEPSGRLLSPDELGNPLFVIANYTFDTTTNDVYRTRDGELHSARVQVSTRATLVRTRKPDPARLEVDVDFAAGEAARLPADRADWLRAYARTLRRGVFTVPLAALRTLEYFAEFAGRLVVIAADYGPTSAVEVREQEKKGLGRHGSFSCPVNFDALAHFARARGGEAHVAHAGTGLPVTLLRFGGEPLGAHVRQAFAASVPSPADAMRVFADQRARKAPDVLTAASWLRSSRWDPMLLGPLCVALGGRRAMGDGVRRLVLEDLTRAAENIYPLPGHFDFDLPLGAALQSLGALKPALRSYQRSLLHGAARAGTYLNMGLCARGLGDKSSARLWLQRACELGEKSGTAERMLRRLDVPTP